MSLELAPMFETPLIITGLDAPGDWEAPLSSRLVGEAGTPRDADAWQSPVLDPSALGPGPVRLVEAVVALADHHSVDIGAEAGPRFRWRPRLNATVLRSGQRQPAHYRPEAFWTAILYLDDGFAGSPDRALGGELELEDPRMPMVLMEAPTLRFRMPGGRAEEPLVRIRPGTGRLLMVPGWLRRGTNVHRGARPQVFLTIALEAVPLG